MEIYLHFPLRIQYFIMSYINCKKILVFMLNTGYAEEGGGVTPENSMREENGLKPVVTVSFSELFHMWTK
jgi:hypothetical protein